MEIPHYYYPDDLLTPFLYNCPCLIIGLQINNCDYVVLTLVPFNAKKLSQLIDKRILIITADKIIFNTEKSAQTFCLLGFINYQNESFPELPLNLIYSNLTKYPITTNIRQTLKIILFSVPDARIMQFYSIEPIILVAGKSLVAQNLLTERMKCHGNMGVVTCQEKGFANIIGILNNCYFDRLNLYQNLSSAIDNELNIIKPWEYQFSVSRTLKNLKILCLSYIYALPTIGKTNEAKSPSPPAVHRRLLGFVIIYIRIMIELVLKTLNFRVLLANLVDISLTAQQIDLRLQQFCLVLSQFSKNTQKNSDSDYIRLYNTLWLILNDMILGVTIGRYAKEFSITIQTFITSTVIHKWLYVEFYKLTIWLTNNPAGFKLNTQLARFFGELYLWIIHFFCTKILLSNVFTSWAIPSLLFLITFAGGVFGATFIISLVCDFVHFITLHVYCFYFASAKIFNWLIVILHSLFNLFYGKRNNILKKRIDSHDYSLDQQLLGTLLFTIILYVLPTVLAFYLSFTVIRLLTLCCMIALEIFLSCLNHFPIFILLLRIKDSFRVPGGIKFVLLNEDVRNTEITSQSVENDETFDNGRIIYLQLLNVPIPLSKIFNPYLILLQRLKLYYFSSSTLKKLLVGIPINVSRNKLYQLLYSMLPPQPIKISELQNALAQYLYQKS